MQFSKKTNKCTLNIGGCERTLKFGMATQEMYLAEFTKHQINNDIAENLFLLYCGLVIGSQKYDADFNLLPSELPANFSFEMAKVWIDDCEDDKIDEAYKFAEECMGFILSAEQSRSSRKINQAKAEAEEMGIPFDEYLTKALSIIS